MKLHNLFFFFQKYLRKQKYLQCVIWPVYLIWKNMMYYGKCFIIICIQNIEPLIIKVPKDMYSYANVCFVTEAVETTVTCPWWS
jgi:hypothetical protein